MPLLDPVGESEEHARPSWNRSASGDASLLGSFDHTIALPDCHCIRYRCQRQVSAPGFHGWCGSHRFGQVGM